ncbi:hypothetical protein B9Q02_11390 [Candidatus Marsarchaeota G1 archaeon BE_D]|uniref:Uncharacterized protein n=1 Tax=Candidatus Marsarchaeota G1 archaeon BE_D TaxID=1978156 RepID=A0A2R6A8G3_9ARCH|nr:MAG: hypothetical protein B9Q02_11390 [Candidatus Marsarchaeota G1 archaeon BE_D]
MQPPIFVLIIAGGYFLLYRFDLSRPFHLCKRATWNEVFRALGMNYVKREKKNTFRFALLLFGFVVSLVALFLPSLESFGLQFVGALVVVFALPSFLGMLASASHVEVLPYPRKGHACVPPPSNSDVTNVSPRPVEPTFRMFYFGLKDAHVMSLPVTNTPFIDQLIAFIEASNKRAFVQIFFQEVHPQQYLELLKWKLLNEKSMLKYKPLPLVWASTLDERLKKVNELLSSNVFAISIFGIVEGDPYEIHATASDEVDHVVVFETSNPALFYWLVKHERPPFAFPNYFGTRVEPPFFFATPRTLPSFLSLPSTGRTLNFLSEKVGEIKPWGVEVEAPHAILEVTFLPKEQRELKLLAFPRRGAMDVYFDGSKIRVFMSGDASKYFRQNGALLEITQLAFDSWFGI